MSARGIDEEWVRRVIANPEWTEPDRSKPHRLLAFGRIPEFGNRLLRVVYFQTGSESRVVTAFFDRGRAKTDRVP